MEPTPAKAILARWRPGIPPDDDPDMAAARTAATLDPSLERWLERHARFQTGVRDALRELPVPGDLADRVLSCRPILRPTFRRIPHAWLAVAACVAALLVGSFLFRESTGSEYETFRRRMVRAALREYRMDVTTPDLSAIRAFLARSGAPADFVMPSGLAQLPVVGAGTLGWQGIRASMVCLDGGNDGMMYLFVVARDSLAGPAPSETEFAQVNRLSTGAWTQDGKTYVLASSAKPEALKKYL